MATNNNAQPNQFTLTGFVAVDATIKSFDNSAVARFPLSVSRKETIGEETTRKSALINCEVWSKESNSARFDLLKKGQLVVISGYIKPENYTDRNGVAQSRITFVCNSVSKPSTEKKAKTEAVAAPVAEPVTEDVPF